MSFVTITPFSRSMARPGGHVDSEASTPQAVVNDWQHAERVLEGKPDRGSPGFVVFPLTLQLPERFRGVAVVKNVPAGGLVKDVFHG